VRILWVGGRDVRNVVLFTLMTSAFSIATYAFTFWVLPGVTFWSLSLASMTATALILGRAHLTKCSLIHPAMEKPQACHGVLFPPPGATYLYLGDER
jgi:hypothetical protein